MKFQVIPGFPGLLATMTGYSGNPILSENLNALYSSCQAFMKIESSNKLKHALRKQTRKTPEFFDLRKEVYYKCNKLKDKTNH